MATAMTTEWFRDWKSPLAQKFKETWGPYLREKAEIMRRD